MFILRFDFRRADFSTASMGELYAASLDMAEWGERNGAMMALFSEHHASPDGYLPSPVVMAAAAAKLQARVRGRRTRRGRGRR